VGDSQQTRAPQSMFAPRKTIERAVPYKRTESSEFNLQTVASHQVNNADNMIQIEENSKPIGKQLALDLGAREGESDCYIIQSKSVQHDGWENLDSGSMLNTQNPLNQNLHHDFPDPTCNEVNKNAVNAPRESCRSEPDEDDTFTNDLLQFDGPLISQPNDVSQQNDSWARKPTESRYNTTADSMGGKLSGPINLQNATDSFEAHQPKNEGQQNSAKPLQTQPKRSMTEVAFSSQNTASVLGLLRSINSRQPPTPGGRIDVLPFNTTSLIKKSDLTTIREWIPKPINFPNARNLALILIYRGSTDHYSAKEFHEKCGSKSPNITVIKSNIIPVIKSQVPEDGWRFGGYTEQTWDQPQKNKKTMQTRRQKKDLPVSGALWKRDERAFLFSLKHKEKYPVKQAENAIGVSDKHGVIFGKGPDIIIHDHCDKKNRNRCVFPVSYECSKHRNVVEASRKYLAGKNQFNVEEIEVYHVVWYNLLE